MKRSFILSLIKKAVDYFKPLDLKLFNHRDGEFIFFLSSFFPVDR